MSDSINKNVSINVVEHTMSESGNAAFNKEIELESEEIKAMSQCANSSMCTKCLLLSIKLPFRFFGGRIYIHWTIIPLIGYLFFLLRWVDGVHTYLLVGLAVSVITCLSLFIHELGHVLVYYYMYGAPLKIVALHLLGGFTLPKRVVQDKKASMAFVSVAGPALNFILAGLFAIPHAYYGRNSRSPVLYMMFYYAFLFNLVVGIFNLLPIWPMDGGRAIRSFALLCCKEKTAVYATSAVSGLFIVCVFIWTIHTRDYLTMSMLLLFVLALAFEVNRIRTSQNKEEEEGQQEGGERPVQDGASTSIPAKDVSLDMHDDDIIPPHQSERVGLLQNPH